MPKTKKPDYKSAKHPTYDTSVITVLGAYDLAVELHGKQKDKIGDPYAMHLEGVRQGVVVLGGDTEEQIAALFHDVLEDTKTTREDLREAGVSERAVRIVEAVTKPLHAVQSEYLEDIVKTKKVKLIGSGAIRVKAADTMHNLRADRIARVVIAKGQYTADRLLKKYRPVLARLLLELDLIVDEDAQKKLATKPIGTGGFGGYSSGTGKGNNYQITSLIGGDWPSAWKAPVLRKWDIKKNETVGFLLANGQVREESVTNTGSKIPRSVFVYVQSVWEKDTSVSFQGVSEDSISDYIAILAEEKKSAKFTGVLSGKV